MDRWSGDGEKGYKELEEVKCRDSKYRYETGQSDILEYMQDNVPGPPVQLW